MLHNYDIGVRYGSLLDPSIVYFALWGELSEHLTELRQAIPDCTTLTGGQFGVYHASLKVTRKRHVNDALYILQQLRLYSPTQEERLQVEIAEGLYLDTRILIDDAKKVIEALKGKGTHEQSEVPNAQILFNSLLWGSAWTGGIPKDIVAVADFLRTNSS